jgi:hypothetical protein
MPQAQHKSKVTRLDHAEIFGLIDSGLSQGEVSRRLHCTQGHISKLLKARRRQAVSNGHPADPPTSLQPVELPINLWEKPKRFPADPPTALQPVELVGEPVSASPAHSDASERISASERIDSALLRDHDSRIAVLEAFMATIQQSAHHSAPERISASAHSDASQRIDPVVWVNRGTHLAADMIKRVKGYATQHRLEMREVIDLALRRFFAGEGGDDA